MKDGLPIVTIGTPFPGDCKYVDMDNNGKIDANDQTYLGYSTKRPEYVLGFDCGFNWKGWNFSMQWTGATHISRNLEQEYRMPFSNNGNVHCCSIMQTKDGRLKRRDSYNASFL